jgi:hypothetical protein
LSCRSRAVKPEAHLATVSSSFDAFDDYVVRFVDDEAEERFERLFNDGRMNAGKTVFAHILAQLPLMEFNKVHYRA